MSRRKDQPPAVDERGEERHPAWGLISAHRGQSGPPGAALFGSDIRHQHTITVRVGTAKRGRDLHHDWLHRDQEFLALEFSEAQWASFISSMNQGQGVPCTIRRREDDYLVPDVVYEPRLQASMDEVRSAAGDAFKEIREAFEAYDQTRKAPERRRLEWAIKNAPANVAFAGQSLNEHAENVVQRARADIEAMVVAEAQRLGLEPGDLSGAPELVAGDES